MPKQLNIRDFVKDVLPPIFVRSLRQLRRGRTPEAPSTPVEELIHSFSSIGAGSYSQYGEDLVLDAAMGCPVNGFFVDIGVNDPVSLSNTKRFSLRGWKGINVEPNPLAFLRFEKDRQLDINLNLGVGVEDSSLTFYNMDPDTLGTFSKEVANRSVMIYKGARIVEAIIIPVMRLDSLLNRYLPRNTQVDFLSIDVEGGELDVLRGNDWETFRPKWIIAEIMISGAAIFDFLLSIGYVGVWCNGTNALFLDRTLRP